MTKFDEEQYKKKIELMQGEEEEEVTLLFSKKYNLPYINLTDVTIELDYLKLLPEEKAVAGKMAIFQGVAKKISVAIQNPNLELTQNIISELQTEYETQIYLSSLSGLQKAWEKYKEVPKYVELTRGIVDISPERIEELIPQTSTIEKMKTTFLERVGSKKARQISELLEILLSGAMSVNASDIHIEPLGEEVKIRLRLDGILHDVLTFSSESYQLLISRIKLISEMKLNIKERAQDGRFSIKTKSAEIEIRSSILPGPYGESIVLRILNPQSIGVNLEELGMHPSLQKLVLKEINKPNGMILTTGPTGSGKTTTLYAFLKKINSPDLKIITVEEPIEYHLAGITQTQTNPEKGYSFTTGLQSILRQDPDVIMVGEIRELEAASIALNAALTGHLVFSTLHTNDAAGTIPRLIELGANPAIIAPAINLTIAQRLLRKLCENCKKATDPTSEEIKTIKRVLDSFPPNIEKPDLKKAKIFKPVGCEKCNNIGYKHRLGIFEAILIDNEIEKMILKNPSEVEIKEASAKQGILNMEQDAIFKILQGVTSLEEARRIIEIN